MKGREISSSATDECVSTFCSADLATNIPSATRAHVDGNPAKVSHMPPKETVNHSKDATTVSSSIDKLEPIAIIGLSLRFPQEATSPQTFWQMLMEKRTAMTDVPTDRFNVNAFFGPGKSKPGVLGVKSGHFIKEDIAAFDAPFFSITPTEAESMDPQQRWLLEAAYEAFENAGISLDQASGSRTSVHVGCFTRDYELMLMNDPELHASYKTTGTASAMLSNRLSWFYNLKGPSLTLDTACSSSLTAIHLACQSLRCGESSMGLVGGCNLIFNPDVMTSMTDFGFLSPDGRSYSFDHRANGYSRGEGFGVVLLKPLHSAIRDGDTIRAVIRATSTNQDGRSPGITQPSGIAQEDMIREAYSRGGLDLAATRFFEAHGTGTSIGDPIEAEAIHKAFEGQHPKGQPLYVGAVKSNIGHTEGASGLAGLIKTVLILEKAIIPPNALFEKVNPKIPSGDWNIDFPLHPIPWPSDGLRRASVSSFGFGGANAHAVLDDAFNFLRSRDLDGVHNTRQSPPHLTELAIQSSGITKPPLEDQIEQPDHKVLAHPQLLVWSAFDEKSLQQMLLDFSQYMMANVDDLERDGFLNELALTLAKKRTCLPFRTYVVAKTKDELRKSLNSGYTQPRRVLNAPKLGFVFSGQGAQWPLMGLELLSFPVYKESLKLAQLHLHSLGCEWDVHDEILSSQSSSNLQDPAYCQPICTILQVALVDLLASWGVVPAAVIGHSSGEIAAAYCIGAISRESAWSIAYHRGTAAALSRSLSDTPLAMMAVGLSETGVQSLLDQTKTAGGHVAIACINSPENTTISGCERRIDVIKLELDNQGIFAKKLRVDVAYHTTYMNNASVMYNDLISQSCRLGSGDLKATMFSSVTGTRVSSEQLRRSSYWVENMTSPVRFKQAVEDAFGSGSSKQGGYIVDHLLEIGPHCTLQGPLKQTLKTNQGHKVVSYSATLVRGESALKTTFKTVGQLFCMGFTVDLRKVNQPSLDRINRCALVDLPSYPWNHSRKYWLESRISRNHRLRKTPQNELLGLPVPDWNPREPRWRNTLRLSELPWIRDHQVNGANVYPAAGMLVMVLEALRQISDPGRQQQGFFFRDVAIQKALIVPSQGSIETQLTLRPSSISNRKLLQWSTFRIFVYENDGWGEICSGDATIEYANISHSHETPGQKHCHRKELYQEHQPSNNVRMKNLNTKDVYEHCATLGVFYGPSFATLKDIRYDGDDGTAASMNLCDWNKGPAEEKQFQRHLIHPAALDAIFQSVFPSLTKGGVKSFPTLVPTKFRHLWIASGCLEVDNWEVKISTKADFVGYRNADSNICATAAATGEELVVGGYEMTFVSGYEGSLSSDDAPKPLCYYIDQKPDIAQMSPEEIVSYCSSGMESRFSDAKLKKEDEKQLACYVAILNSLETCQSEEVRVAKPYLERYCNWMRHQMDNNTTSHISAHGEQWEACGRDPDCRQRLLENVRGYDAEGSVISSVATNLTSILKGEVDGLSLLFGENSLMEHYYDYSHNSPAFSKVKRYVDAFAHKNSCFRILEIGAGTGGATEMMLQELLRQSLDSGGSPRFAEYVYTDISPTFFEKAKQRFRDAQSKMTFATLNIEEDPVEQGFEEGGYDLIIASHVLHATRDIETTLGNTRKLLKAGGKLIADETISPEAILPAFIFGILPGWWLGEEENRKWGPLLNEADWNNSLVKAGFSGIDFSLRNNHEVPLLGSSAMFSTAVEIEKTALRSIKCVIFTAATMVHENELANQLCAKLNSIPSVQSRICSVDDSNTAETSQSVCIFLLEVQRAFLHDISEAAYFCVQRVISSCQTLLWVTREDSKDPVNQLVQGFARCIREENRALRFITASLEVSRGTASMVESILRIFQSAIVDTSNSSDQEFVEIDGMLNVGRVIEASSINQHIHHKTIVQSPKPKALGEDHLNPVKLSIAAPGMLDTLEFVDDLQASLPLPDDEVEIEIKAGGLNFRDVLIAMGQVTGTHLGGECAGIVTRTGAKCSVRPGDKVFGFIDGSFATFGRGKSSVICKVPENVTFATAAAMPTVYCTALHCLSHVARIKAGETILIHSAAGGFGQAVLHLAKVYRAEIFATVGSDEKRQFLVDTYSIPDDHIFSSRSDSFAEGVKRMTRNRGVDVIINSLAGEALRSSWECVAPFGRFIEVGKKDVYNYGTIPMYPFAKNATFACVDLVHMLHEGTEVVGALLKDVMEMLQNGKVTAPQPLHVYKASGVEEAFRYMQSGKNMGKIVVEFNQDDIVPTVPSMLPTWTFDEDATYLITGGFGGLGRCTARWMSTRKARNLILLGRQGAKSSSAKQLLEELTSKGITVAAPPCDVTDRDALAHVLVECNRTMPPIKGCIVGTMVLKDSVFETMSYSDFRIPINPKLAGTRNLHELLPHDLDFFVCLSSMSGIIGVSGQSNYAAGNSYQDALTHHRIAAGQKAVSLNLGVVLSVGYVAEHERVKSLLKDKGYMGVREEDYLALLDYYCDPRLPVLSHIQCQVVTGVQTPAELQKLGIPEPFYMQTPMFRHLRQIRSEDAARSSLGAGASASHTADATLDLQQLLGAATDLADVEFLMLDGLTAKVAKSLDVDRGHIDTRKPLHAYGVDSLAAVELRTWLRRDVGAEVAVFDILGNGSVADLAKMAVSRSRFVAPSLKQEQTVQA